MKEVISPNVKIIGPEQAGLHKLAHGLTMANGDVCCLLDSSDYNARFVSPDIVVLELALQKVGVATIAMKSKVGSVKRSRRCVMRAVSTPST